MSTKETGGPAFARPESESLPFSRPAQSGITTRDYFAAKAIPFIQWNSDNTALCAKRCYEIADALLEARK